MKRKSREETVAARRYDLELAWMRVLARAALRRRGLIAAARRMAAMELNVARASGRVVCRDALHQV